VVARVVARALLGAIYHRWSDHSDGVVVATCLPEGADPATRKCPSLRRSRRAPGACVPILGRSVDGPEPSQRQPTLGRVADGSHYGRAIVRRGWEDAKRTAREQLRWNLFIALAVAGLAYAVQGDSGEQAAWDALLLTVAALAGLAVVALACHVIWAPVRLLREKDRELETARAAVQRLERAQRPPAQLSFGRPEIPSTSQVIKVSDRQGQLWPTRPGRVIRVPVINAQGAGEAKQVHARLRFTDASGRSDRAFMPPETQGRWSGEEEPGEVVDLPGNGRPRLLDVVVILDGAYPHAFEWTTQSRYAGLNGYAINANPFRIEVDVMGAGNGGEAPRLTEVLEVDCRPKSMLKADWLGPSRVPDQGDTWVAWDNR
jgi:hypothetical protein